VRIRSRNPWTRARRRLFGWKVRLPLATAPSPCCVWHHVPRTCRSVMPGRDAMAVGKLCVSFANRRGPRAVSRSLPYRRHSGDCSRVLTSFGWVKPVPAYPDPLTVVTAVTSSRAIPKNLCAMLQNGWHPLRKLLASGTAVSVRNGPRQPGEDGGSETCPGNPWWVSGMAVRHTLADRRRNEDNCPVHTCG
jgi:hypothetical protein